MKTNKFSWRSSLAEIKSYSTLGEFQKRYYNIEMRKDGNKTGLVIPGEIANVARTLEKKGFEAYLIGGCVRDLLLDRKPKD